MREVKFAMNKATIINKVNKIAEHPAFKEAVGSEKVGKTQFRTLCDLAEKAECVEELALLIDYKAAKDNKGWGLTRNGESVGELVKKGLLELAGQITGENADIRKIKMASLYFGYLHWAAAVVRQERFQQRENQHKEKNIQNARR